MSAEFSEVVRPNKGLRAPRPVNDADMEQARLFDEMLQDAITDLEDRIEIARARWMNRTQGQGVNNLPPEHLSRLHAELMEAQRLLAALRNRFW